MLQQPGRSRRTRHDKATPSHGSKAIADVCSLTIRWLTAIRWFTVIDGVIVLDLSEPTVQTSETACWLLSTIEGLRSSGQLQTLTARDVVVQTDGHWITSAGRTGL